MMIMKMLNMTILSSPVDATDYDHEDHFEVYSDDFDQ